jgi:ABC-2 type transport system ATP-binding protein
MIIIKGLTKFYNKKSPPAISDVSFEVKNGELVGFVGLNGAGKTTTLRISSGIILPSRGSVEIDGFDIVNDKVEASYRLGFVPEIPNFDPNAKGLDLLIYFMGFYGITGREAREKARELFMLVGLEGAENKKINSYSQGMKKRFSLAASLISDPQNLLLDEVLNGLDPSGIKFFRDFIMEIKSRNKAILLSSHILSEVQTLSDKVVIIHKGKIIKQITREELERIGEREIRISVEGDIKEAEKILLYYGNLRKEGGKFILTNFKAEPYDVNFALVSRGIKVKEFLTVNQNLEDYFLNLIKTQGG